MTANEAGNPIVKQEGDDWRYESDGNEYVEDKTEPRRACRLCACPVDEPIYIFGDAGKELQLALKINMSLPVTVTPTDLLPKQICSTCVRKLLLCHEFSELCVVAEEKLTKYAETQNIIEDTDDACNAETGKFRKTYCCPLCPQGKMVLHNGAGEVGEGYQDVQKDTTGTQDQVQQAPALAEPQETRNETNLRQPLVDNLWSVSGGNSDSDNSFEYDTDVFVEENSVSVPGSEDTIFICRICGELFSTVELSYKHTNAHIQEGIFPCVLCDSSYSSESDLQNHFKQHESEQLSKTNEASCKSRGMFNRLNFLKCSKCKKGFYTEERYKFHCQFHEGAQERYCGMCERWYTTETQLYRHMTQFHHSTTSFHCNHCGDSFLEKGLLDKHTCKYQSNETYKCKTCDAIFERKMSLVEHSVTHYDVIRKDHGCNMCGTIFTSKARLVKHMKEHHHSKIYSFQTCISCSTCSALFSEINSALRHCQGHITTGETDTTKVEEIVVKRVFVCEFCETYFANTKHLNRHRLVHVGSTDPYQCTVCNLYFQTYNQAHVHRKCHSDIIQDDPTKVVDPPFTVPIYFTCEPCQKDFKLWEGLYVHWNRVHGISNIAVGDVSTSEQPVELHGQKQTEALKEAFNCDLCERYFGRPSHLAQHKKQTHDNGEFRCEDCGKVLAHLSGLVIHRRQHTGEKPFTCDICGKRFRQSAGMYTHRRTHTKDYPYQCEICSHGFNNKGDLNNHRRSKHTKERPFKCQVCNKAFLTSGVYYQHKMLHAGIRKYKCTYCGRDFSRWNALRLHTRTHTGEKPYKCDMCGRGFAQKGDMKKHRRTQHGATD